MSELEIRVRTRLRKRTDIEEIVLPESHHPIAWAREACLDRADRRTTHCYPVYKNRVTIELDPETLQMMQKENVEDASIDVEISDDEVMMDEEEESDTFEGFDSPLMSAPSQMDSPNNATSSPINIPGNSAHEGPRTRRTSSGGTPTHLSYLSRMFPGVQCDSASSPLSSGYGSAPRCFHSASTQTPSTPVFCETLIRLRILSLSSNQSDERHQQVTRRRQIQIPERRARSRVYSENNSDDLRAEEEGNRGNSDSSLRMPLPDLVAFRDRSNSAPTNLMRPEIRVGRQLRRISDEFHLSYHDQQRLQARQQQTILQRLTNVLRSYHRGPREGSPV